MRLTHLVRRDYGWTSLRVQEPRRPLRPRIEFEDGRVYREESSDMAARIRAGKLLAAPMAPSPPLVTVPPLLQVR